MIVVLDPAAAQQAISVRTLACPDCGGRRLRRWGHARPRRLRRADGGVDRLHPARIRCTGCRRSHVLLPAHCLPHHGDEVATIGAALAAHLRGHGHRRVAADLDRPADTVRGWLRAARRHAQPLWQLAIGQAIRFDPDPGGHWPRPAGGPLHDAVAALAWAATAVATRLGLGDPAALGLWQLINVIIGGRLLAPARGS